MNCTKKTTYLGFFASASLSSRIEIEHDHEHDHDIGFYTSKKKPQKEKRGLINENTTVH